jgi:hypothetical protein
MMALAVRELDVCLSGGGEQWRAGAGARGEGDGERSREQDGEHEWEREEVGDRARQVGPSNLG